MKIEEHGKKHAEIIVMLHGANFVQCYGRQYPLAEKYRILVPHIMGFGDEAAALSSDFLHRCDGKDEERAV